MMKNYAIILSGGKGERLGFEKPKQFLKFAGKSSLEHTIDVFYKHARIDAIFIAAHIDTIAQTHALIKDYCDKKIIIVKGGKTRNQSSFAALCEIDKMFALDSSRDQNDAESRKINVLIHDAARPLLSARIIDDCLACLKHERAVDVAIEATDTIIQAHITQTNARYIQSIPNRNSLFLGQTPQCFDFELILKAYKKAHKNNSELDKFSDDCGLLLANDKSAKIAVVRGDFSNHKLTRKEDIPLIDRLFQIKTATLDAQNFSHLKNKVIVVFGGTSGIGLEIIKEAKKYGAKTHALSRRTDCNIANPKDIKRALKNIAKKEGKIDCVMNLAGILRKNRLNETKINEIGELIDANYTGALYIAKYAYKYLAHSRGMLIFTSSSSYTRGREGYCIYSSLKSGIVNLTQALSDEWSNSGIKVNCIVPGRTRTPMRKSNFGAENKATLLKAKIVAKKYLDVFLSQNTGAIIEVYKND